MTELESRGGGRWPIRPLSFLPSSVESGDDILFLRYLRLFATARAAWRINFLLAQPAPLAAAQQIARLLQRRCQWCSSLAILHLEPRLSHQGKRDAVLQ